MILRFPCSVVTSVIFVFLVSGSLLAGETANSIGKKIPDFKLPDHRGRQASLSDFQDKKAVVVVFIGTECPINNAFMPRLAALHKEYADKGNHYQPSRDRTHGVLHWPVMRFEVRILIVAGRITG